MFQSAQERRASACEMQVCLKCRNWLELSVSTDKRGKLFLKISETTVYAPLSAGSEVSESDLQNLFKILSPHFKGLENKAQF